MDLQGEVLLAADVDERHLHHDKTSGARDDRLGLKACLDDLRQRDVLVNDGKDTGLSRAGRSGRRSL